MPSKEINNVIKDLDQRIVEMMNKHVLSGMAVGVVHEGKLIYKKGFGLADAKSEKPVTPETIFRIASISKTFTAIGLMQLWEQGKFKLDDPVNDYLKTYQVLHPDPNAKPVTFRHMLTHTSGIGEMRDMNDLLTAVFSPRDDSMYYKPDQPLPSLSTYFEGLLVPDVPPEQKWAYANNAYATIAQLIEDISGERFPEYMINHVFEPLGMMHTDYEYTDRIKHELAQGYENKDGYLKAVEFFKFPGMGAGSISSNVEDMALYMAALTNGGKNENASILKPKTLEMMMEPHYQPDEHLAAMGLGFFLEFMEGHKAAWHGGALPGFNSSMWVAPDDNLGVIVFANTATRAIYHFGQGILASLLGIDETRKKLPLADIPNSPHLWKDMVGYYGPSKGINSNARIWMGMGGEVEVYINKQNQLALRSLAGGWKQGIPLFPIDRENPLVFENVTDGKTTQLVFQKNAEGYIDRISFTSLSFFTMFKRQKTESLHFKIRALIGAVAGFIGLIVLKSIFKKKK